MLTTYSLKEMTEIWRRRLGLLTDDCGCAVTRHDGTSLNALIADRIRAWYASLLLTAESSLLPVSDLSEEVTAARRVSANCIEIDIPDRGVRPILVQLSDWEEPVGIFLSPDSPESLRQRCSRLAASPRHPLAVVAGRTMRLYGLRTSTAKDSGAVNAPDMLLHRIEKLLMVVAPKEKDTFSLDQSLLLTIPTNI